MYKAGVVQYVGKMATEIHIIANTGDARYSIGGVRITKNAIYFLHKILGTDLHTSRYANGEYTHIRSRTTGHMTDLGKRTPIKNFRGIEAEGTMAAEIEAIPKIYKKAKRNYKNMVEIDLTEHKKGTLNISLAIFTEDQLPKLQQMEGVQLYTKTNPHIAIITRISPTPINQ